MNPSGEYKGQQYKYGWNVDGWTGSEMRTYANGDFFNKLPKELRDAIIDTRVVSGHGSSDSNSKRETDGNWESTDKIYLLSSPEVWGDCTQSNCYDTATGVTRQLDYYANIGESTSKWWGATKEYNESRSFWWLRTAHSNYEHVFLLVSSSGNPDSINANNNRGFAPAFRIG